MKLIFVFSCAYACLSISVGRHINSRSISRATTDGIVSLVEFHMRGVNYGQCSYTNQKGEDVMLIYEDKGQGIYTAASPQPTVIDPVEEARSCRSAATEPPVETDPDQSIKDAAEKETDIDLLMRFCKVQRHLSLNRLFGSYLSARYLGYLLVAPPAETGGWNFNEGRSNERPQIDSDLVTGICNFQNQYSQSQQYEGDQLTPRFLNFLNWLATTSATSGMFRQKGALATEISLGSIYLTLPPS